MKNLLEPLGLFFYVTFNFFATATYLNAMEKENYSLVSKQQMKAKRQNSPIIITTDHKQIDLTTSYFKILKNTAFFGGYSECNKLNITDKSTLFDFSRIQEKVPYLNSKNIKRVLMLLCRELRAEDIPPTQLAPTFNTLNFLESNALHGSNKDKNFTAIQRKLGMLLINHLKSLPTPTIEQEILKKNVRGVCPHLCVICTLPAIKAIEDVRALCSHKHYAHKECIHKALLMTNAHKELIHQALLTPSNRDYVINLMLQAGCNGPLILSRVLNWSEKARYYIQYPLYGLFLGASIPLIACHLAITADSALCLFLKTQTDQTLSNLLKATALLIACIGSGELTMTKLQIFERTQFYNTIAEQLPSMEHRGIILGFPAVAGSYFFAMDQAYQLCGYYYGLLLIQAAVIIVISRMET